MAKSRKPFEQYVTVAADGRLVVEMFQLTPVRATIWLVAHSKSDAHKRASLLGAPDALFSILRPGIKSAEAATADANEAVFIRDWPVSKKALNYLPGAGLRNYIEGTGPAF